MTRRILHALCNLAKHAADAFDDALCRMTDLGGEE